MRLRALAGLLHEEEETGEFYLMSDVLDTSTEKPRTYYLCPIKPLPEMVLQMVADQYE